ncbi:unnamed protein product [Phaedon cochleariae]|uniref:Bromodomain adjacent to zinc finger domain protein 2B n=1 Tax=Phaedon cochleariae TaxID=80249 RepID=A0A9P0GQT5_PHACE|nr:unnamed protein product [Phaedon cochleariae]
MQGKEGRPRNLGRGVSKPKKNTVASLLAQSRALGIKPVPMLDPNISMNQQMNLLKSNILAAQQYLSETAGGGGGGAGGVATAADEKALNRFIQEKLRGALSDSKMEAEMMTTAAAAAAKRQKHYDERLLRVPLEKGWKRETIIRGLTKSGGLRGDVTYAAPDSSNKFKQMSDVTQYLDYQKTSDLTKDHFTFSCRCIIGDYLQPVPPEMQAEGGEFVHLSEEDVIRRLEELKSAMRTSLPVEQRIEMARRQQAARAAARSDREQARMHKELERSERQEQARREREARSQQAMEAKRKRQEEMERHKHEEQQRKQQERELKRQQAAMLKEQERERRRQHMALVRSLESRRKLEEREKKKQQLLAEKMANKEKKLEQRRVELEILTEIRRPCEDLELDQNVLPDYERIPGLRLSGKAFSDTLMVFEFLHNFGETLGFDMDSLPTLAALQRALLPSEHSQEAEDELFSVMTHLLVCAIEDPGIPNPARYTTMLGQSLRQADITPTNISEILRIYLYANATGEVKALTGVHFERDREKRVADHHQTDDEMSVTQAGKNAMYYEVLHNNPTYKLSDLLKHKPYMSLSPTTKVEILAFICNELLQNKAVIRQIESSLESCAQQKKEKWLLDMKIRKLKMLHNRKVRTEAMEKAQVKLDGDESAVDSPSLHKDYLLDEEENEMSENESVGTQPEEEEDNKLSGEELGKKLEKLVKTSETHLQTLNTASLQLRAICFGQDRYFRRYWSLPKAGGVFVEAMESADPEEFEEQLRLDGLETSTTTTATNGISCLNDLDEIRDGLEEIDDANDDKEVSRLVGTEEKETENNPDRSDNHATDHRKTPNRLSCFENGESVDKSEHNLAELKRSVDDIVQNLERTLEMDKEKRSSESLVNQRSSESLVNHVKEERVEEDEEEEEEETPFGSKKFNLFERLGQCMERENKSEEDLKAEVGAEVKEELKKEILNELKSEIKSELIKLEPKYEQATDASSEDAEHRWFGILPADGATCDGVHLTAGSRWENGGVGACTRDITELKIPVFPPPGANSTGNYHNSCDSPAPLQMTADESAQLEHIKKHGMPRPSEKKRVPKDKRYGWWRIIDPAHLRRVLDALQSRGARERELKRAIVGVQQSMYEGGGGNKGRLFVEPGRPDLVDLVAGDDEEEEEEGEGERGEVRMEGDAPRPDGAAEWRPGVARRVDLFLLEQVEALEDKVASASMQVKGWKIPSRDLGEIPYKQIVSVAKERLAFLELNIERRYLKPPLGINTGDPNLAAMSQESCAVSSASSATCGAAGQSSPGGLAGTDLDVPKGLATWREAINRCSTSAQLAMCLYALEGSIAWDKSIMKANCQFCHSGDNEDKLLLCDGCDKGYHTYCFKPKMDNIPEGDWYCHECMNKATGERNCIVCGKKSSSTSAKLVPCDLCPRAYHTDCHRPPLPKSPRGKWYCSNCVGRKPHKKTPVKKNHKAAGTREGEQSGELTPSSPAPSHCSTATNEDLPPPVGGDPFNSSMANACSPSAVSTAPCPPSAASAAASSSPSASVSYAPSAAAALAASAAAAATASANLKKEKANHKRLMRELAPCRALLEDLECHDDAWPFLLPVNTKQFPTYKKIIKVPMDLSTIKKRLLDMQYKSRDDFCTDVRQIFNNCETFNEDDSPVGKAGHCMRQFFEQRWTELCCAQQPQLPS